MMLRKSVLVVISSGMFLAWAPAQIPSTSPPPTPGLTLSSPAFADGAVIPNRYSQEDPNPVSPKLEWTNVPTGTATFTLMIIDPDTALQKKDEDVLHWLLFNIPGNLHELPEGVSHIPQLPDGTIQAKSRRGALGYVGPGAPAVGPYHHFLFLLYALDTKLSLGPDATRADVAKAMDGHILGKGVLVGRFHR
jgi:Raf kinase inhibitor-like YbhB/YbcL family protein